FNDEPGADVVAAILETVLLVEIAAVNVLEIAYDAVRRSGRSSSALDVIASIQRLPIDIRWDMNEAMVEIAARFKSRSRISLADAFALSLAELRSAPLATSDHQEFGPIETGGQARFLWIR
ncbi:MAG: type II toxin-antitoxin system VapC family toxin, partial [Cytophagaceae bacterium]